MHALQCPLAVDNETSGRLPDPLPDTGPNLHLEASKADDFTVRFRAATSLVKRSPQAVGSRRLRLGMHAAQLTDCQRQAASGTVNLMGIRDDELMNIKDERFASVSECSVRLAKDEEERDFA